MASVERHTPRMEVGDLKLSILQQLLAHPTLAREFNQDVIDEHVHGDDRVDREIAEVWRASTATTAAEAAALSRERCSNCWPTATTPTNSRTRRSGNGD